MKETKFGQNFFESTRGQIVSLLRRGIDTVEELSLRLGLTDNAVRAHLETLARDGLVERRGTRRGLRKPHFSYALTGDAEQLFPKAYPALLNQLLAVLKRRLSPGELEAILRETAVSLAASPDAASRNDESIESRAQKVLEVLEALGGAPKLDAEEDRLVISSFSSCPFAATVSEHPEVCRLAEILLTEVAGVKVKEHCQKGATPSCSFEITANGRG
ncbi:MAG: ArsR family transcriptional regulator [Acidobacteriota bacterium]|nr:ArsR family transcriptional regulator [Acidobacteriota bacterium]